MDERSLLVELRIRGGGWEENGVEVQLQAQGARVVEWRKVATRPLTNRLVPREARGAWWARERRIRVSRQHEGQHQHHASCIWDTRGTAKDGTSMRDL